MENPFYKVSGSIVTYISFCRPITIIIMSRRPVNPARRIADGGGLPFVGSSQSKTRSSPLISIGLVVTVFFVAILLTPFLFHFFFYAFYPFA